MGAEDTFFTVSLKFKRVRTAMDAGMECVVLFAYLVFGSSVF